MSFLHTTYCGRSVRTRFREMLGLDAGPGEWLIRLAVLAFMVRTCMNPAEHIYIGPGMWALMILTFFFYL